MGKTPHPDIPHEAQDLPAESHLSAAELFLVRRNASNKQSASAANQPQSGDRVPTRTHADDTHHALGVDVSSPPPPGSTPATVGDRSPVPAAGSGSGQTGDQPHSPVGDQSPAPVSNRFGSPVGDQSQVQPAKPFENPFNHLTRIQELVKKEDMDGVHRELVAAVKAAGTIDRTLMQANKVQVEEQLKVEQDADKRKHLEDLRGAYDQMDHALAFSKTMLARFELANKNFSGAELLLKQVEGADPTFAHRPEVKFDDLKKAAQEPSTWENVLGATKGILKELVCDAAAVGAAVGAGVVTSETGPGAIGFGLAAGAATYTAARTLVFRDQFSWDMPFWGALDGLSGGTAALARTALVRVGGKLVTKEVAEQMAVKAGVELTGLTAKEGTLAYGKAVEQLGKEGLAQMAKTKNLNFLTRVGSHIPITSLGNTSYRAGVNAVRGVTMRNMAGGAVVNGGMTFVASSIYRAGHDANDYRTGKYSSLGDLASNYNKHVAGDTIRGLSVGLNGVNLVYGSVGALGLNGVREAVWGDNQSTRQWLDNTVKSSAVDMTLGFGLGFLSQGKSGSFLDQKLNVNGADALRSSYVVSSPLIGAVSEFSGRVGEVAQQIDELLKKPASQGDLQMNFVKTPGPDEYPTGQSPLTPEKPDGQP